MQVGIHHYYDGLIIREIAHEAGHGLLLSQLTGGLTPVAGDHFIAAVRLLPHHAGDKHTILPDTVGHLHHGVIHSYLERMVGKVADLAQRNIQDGFSFRAVTLLLRGKQVIERGQKI